MTAPDPTTPQPPPPSAWPFGIFVAILGGLIVATALQYPATTVALMAASGILFVTSLWACQQLMGQGPTWRFAALALLIGWFAEQMGSSRGWFFGRYEYTDVLGLPLGNVPVVIPLMWFALCFTAYVLACLMLWRQPTHLHASQGSAVLTAGLAAMLVTAFDLGADPYFVFVLKAWVMTKTDGGWFGETLQGFVGWMFTASVIVLCVQRWFAPNAPVQPTPLARRASLVALLIYASGMVFQMVFGHPIETRAIAFFAMGIPLLVASVAWWQWQQPPKERSL